MTTTEDNDNMSDNPAEKIAEYLNGHNKKKAVEKALLNKIHYIGEEIPESIAKDKRKKFVLLGTPKELIDEIE